MWYKFTACAHFHFCSSWIQRCHAVCQSRGTLTFAGLLNPFTFLTLTVLMGALQLREGYYTLCFILFHTVVGIRDFFFPSCSLHSGCHWLSSVKCIRASALSALQVYYHAAVFMLKRAGGSSCVLFYSFILSCIISRVHAGACRPCRSPC